ncbi:DUF1360 domain-containing protein [Bacillus songklensis]|uniref:DUF1360 domain-containing protein n=1 Tax=Bacillus songklensis TaxID=1069116 RepID=A0ABV8B5L4_9BACI
MTWFELILFVLATFRLTRLIVFDKITLFLRKPFHEVVEETQEDGSVVTYLNVRGTGIRKWIGELLSCYWCTGMWCAIFLYLGFVYIPHLTLPVVTILAIAGVAGILESRLE